jgi:hypothetical protein
MTNDERISSYIDNELSSEQEQEFLISLAASDGLRKSFRSELVMKKVVRRDEMLTNPPREMRAAVFATLGLSAASALSASKANAATSSPAPSAPQTVVPSHPASSAPAASHGLLKTLFATKMNTLVTAAGISLSALGGYGVHAIVTPTAAPTTQQSLQTAPAPAVVPSNVPASSLVSEVPAVSEKKASPTLATSHKAKRTSSQIAASKAAQKTTEDTKQIDPGVVGTAGGGDLNMEPPKVGKK